jgi:hypothetical protein
VVLGNGPGGVVAAGGTGVGATGAGGCCGAGCCADTCGAKARATTTVRMRPKERNIKSCARGRPIAIGRSEETPL